MNLAAAAGGAAARVIANRAQAAFNNYMAPAPAQQPYNFRGMRNALPRGNRRGRGRGRRPQVAKTGGQPSAGVSNTRSSTKIVVRDTETFATPEKFTAYSFNPSCDKMPRLKQHENMYKRYRIRYMNIAYRSGSGTATEGNISFGIEGGVKDDKVTAENVMALRPSFFTPAWKNDTMSLGSDIDIARWMICGDATTDGVAFTLYVNPTAAKIGMIQISYEVEFDQPRPF